MKKVWIFFVVVNFLLSTESVCIVSPVEREGLRAQSDIRKINKSTGAKQCRSLSLVVV